MSQHRPHIIESPERRVDVLLVALLNCGRGHSAGLPPAVSFSETSGVPNAARFASGAYALQIQADYPQYVEEMIEENAGGRR